MTKAFILMIQYGVDAVPFSHEKLDEWRNNRKGITFLHQKKNFLIQGSIDDLWVKPNGELILVDYKATSKKDEVNLDSEWQDGYKRQIKVYQWLLRSNRFAVSKRGYFVYCNGKKDREKFNAKLEFDISILPYDGDDAWIEPRLIEIRHSLEKSSIPQAAQVCSYCVYRLAASEQESL